MKFNLISTHQTTRWLLQNVHLIFSDEKFSQLFLHIYHRILNIFFKYLIILRFSLLKISNFYFFTSKFSEKKLKFSLSSRKNIQKSCSACVIIIDSLFFFIKFLCSNLKIEKIKNLFFAFQDLFFF